MIWLHVIMLKVHGYHAGNFANRTLDLFSTCLQVPRTVANLTSWQPWLSFKDNRKTKLLIKELQEGYAGLRIPIYRLSFILLLNANIW